MLVKTRRVLSAVPRGETIPKEAKRAEKASTERILLCSTRSNFDGYEVVRELGVVSTSATRTLSFALTAVSRAKAFLLGGEIDFYTAMLNRVASDATHRTILEADKLGANAILSLRIHPSHSVDITGFVATTLALGTAVEVRPKAGAAPEGGVRAFSVETLDGVSTAREELRTTVSTPSGPVMTRDASNPDICVPARSTSLVPDMMAADPAGGAGCPAPPRPLLAPTASKAGRGQFTTATAPARHVESPV